MKKQIIDCSLPLDHPDRVKIVDIVGAERDALLALSAIAEQKAAEPKPLNLEERLAALEQKVETAAVQK